MRNNCFSGALETKAKLHQIEESAGGVNVIGGESNYRMHLNWLGCEGKDRDRPMVEGECWAKEKFLFFKMTDAYNILTCAQDMVSGEGEVKIQRQWRKYLVEGAS